MTFFWSNESEPQSAIFDDEGNQLFETAGILEIQIGESKIYSNQTLENGEIATDNAIDSPNQVNLQMIFSPNDYIESYAQLKERFDLKESFSIQTRVDTYDNMRIESMPHDESASIANTVAVNLSFVEQQLVGSSSDTLTELDVDSAADQSTVASGQKQSTESSTVLGDLFGGFL